MPDYLCGLCWGRGGYGVLSTHKILSANFALTCRCRRAGQRMCRCMVSIVAQTNPYHPYPPTLYTRSCTIQTHVLLVYACNEDVLID